MPHGSRGGAIRDRVRHHVTGHATAPGRKCRFLPRSCRDALLRQPVGAHLAGASVQTRCLLLPHDVRVHSDGARPVIACYCFECDKPVRTGWGGWYRCAHCGYESLRVSPAALQPPPLPDSMRASQRALQQVWDGMSPDERISFAASCASVFSKWLTAATAQGPRRPQAGAGLVSLSNKGETK